MSLRIVPEPFIAGHLVITEIAPDACSLERAGYSAAVHGQVERGRPPVVQQLPKPAIDGASSPTSRQSRNRRPGHDQQRHSAATRASYFDNAKRRRIDLRRVCVRGLG